MLACTRIANVIAVDCWLVGFGTDSRVIEPLYLRDALLSLARCDQLMHRRIGSYLRIKHRMSMTSLVAERRCDNIMLAVTLTLTINHNFHHICTKQFAVSSRK